MLQTSVSEAEGHEDALFYSYGQLGKEDVLECFKLGKDNPIVQLTSNSIFHKILI